MTFFILDRQLDHPNLCKFIGGSIEVPYVTIITEYCPKGSLSDVLLNDDIPINWGFRWETFIHFHFLHVDHWADILIFSLLFEVARVAPVDLSLAYFSFLWSLYSHLGAEDHGLITACCWLDEGLCGVFFFYSTDNSTKWDEIQNVFCWVKLQQELSYLVSIPQMGKNSFPEQKNLS